MFTFSGNGKLLLAFPFFCVCARACVCVCSCLFDLLHYPVQATIPWSKLLMRIHCAQTASPSLPAKIIRPSISSPVLVLTSAHRSCLSTPKACPLSITRITLAVTMLNYSSRTTSICQHSFIFASSKFFCHVLKDIGYLWSNTVSLKTAPLDVSNNLSPSTGFNWFCWPLWSQWWEGRKGMYEAFLIFTLRLYFLQATAWRSLFYHTSLVLITYNFYQKLTSLRAKLL